MVSLSHLPFFHSIRLADLSNDRPRPRPRSIHQCRLQFVDERCVIVQITDGSRGETTTQTVLSQNRIRFVQDAAYGFLRDFNAEDIVCVNLFPTSVDIWQTSEPIRQLVASNLEMNRSVSVRFSYTITRNPPNQDDSEDIAAVVTSNRTVTIEKNEVETRKILREILVGSDSDEVNK